MFDCVGSPMIGSLMFLFKLRSTLLFLSLVLSNTSVLVADTRKSSACISVAGMDVRRLMVL